MTAEELHNKYEEDLKKLQESCPHEHTQEGNEYWAPGHGTGRVVEMCLDCWKTVRIVSEPPKFDPTIIGGYHEIPHNP